jgi:hypothetical protein
MRLRRSHAAFVAERVIRQTLDAHYRGLPLSLDCGILAHSYLGVLDRREQAHAAAAARAGEHGEVEAAPHQVGPRPVAGFAGSLATELGDLRRGGVGDGVRQRDPRALIGDGEAAPAGMGSEDPVVEHEIDAGARRKGSELFRGAREA